ncbi:Gloverin [Eumeta japonica]|uniref:Gloverin n=1 Tax=Eumeta variegata TaxID=151549 RepID=A0A4C1VFW4_EUMVA|nr:Gloverin [Eumeta japonica]
MKSTLCVIVSLAAVALAQIQYEGESASVDRMQRPPPRPMRRSPETSARAKRPANGQNDYGLYGKGVYEKNIFHDSRGKLDGRVQGTRVLGPFEDSSHVGGGLTWETNNAVSTLDLNKEIGGRTRLDATYGGKWHLDPRTDFSLGAGYSQTFPGSGPQFGINGKLTFPG